MSHGANCRQPPYIHSSDSPKETELLLPNPNKDPGMYLCVDVAGASVALDVPPV